MSITLKTATKSLTIDKKNIKGSEYIRELVEAGETEIQIPEDVPEPAMEFIIEWLGEHSEIPLGRIERPLTKPLADTLTKEFDKNFLKKIVPDETKPALLLAVVKAANVLAIKDLTQFGAAAIASIIRDKKTEEIRKIFDLKDDFSEEEKKALAAEAKYAIPASR